MYTLFQMSKKGFTLIELMIVMSIIGILASSLYPSVTGYFQRAKVVEYQTWGAELVQLAKNYNNEIGALEGPAETSAGGYYSICEVSAGCWQPLDSFSTYITKNNPSIWRKMDRLNPVGYSTINIDSWPLNSIWSQSPFFFNFPGRDMASNTKSHAISWFMYGIAPEMAVGGIMNLSGTVSGNSNNMPISANKRCSPGIAWFVENSPPSLVYTWCIYFLD